MKTAILKNTHNRLSDLNNVSRFKDLSSLPETFFINGLMPDVFLDDLVEKARAIALKAYINGVNLPAA